MEKKEDGRKEQELPPKEAAPDPVAAEGGANSAEELTALHEKHRDINDKYTRLYADFENYRRRTSKERIELLKVAGEGIILAVLPVLDDMERAVAHNKGVSDIKALKEGMDVIRQKFKSTIAALGVEAMDTAGMPFDSELHDAVTSIDAPSEDMKGKIVEEVQRGYLLNGKVIRHAKVVVGK